MSEFIGVPDNSKKKHDLNRPVEPKPKPADVKIVQISPTNIPTQMGALMLVIFGLGDDGEVWAWNAKKRIWVEN